MSKKLEKEVQILRKKTADLEEKVSDLTTQYLLQTTRLQASEEKHQEAETKVLHLEEENAILRHEYLKLQRERFGKKSERFVDDTPDHLPLFEVPDSTADSKEAGSTGSPTEPEQRDSSDEPDSNNPADYELVTFLRKKRGSKKPDLSQLPTREVIIPVPESARTCGCGRQKEAAGYAIRHRLHFIPATLEMWIIKREKMACRKGCEGKGTVVTAPVVPHILPKCSVTESMLAYVAVSKVLDRQPLYHLEKKIEQRYFWRISRQTMARWLIQLAEPLQKLVNLMKDEIVGYGIAALDATVLQVLNEPGRDVKTKNYIYCIRGGPPDKGVVLYEYNAYSDGRAPKDYVKETLLDFEGVLSCDASPVFNEVGAQEKVRLSYCHAHARRKFEVIEKSLRGSKTATHSLAKQAMQIYQALYKVEQDVTEIVHQKKEHFALNPQAHWDIRLAMRQEKSQPLLASFYTWLQENQLKTLPHSTIGQAIAYALNHWEGLQVYLTDGRIPIDNNATERDIKPFVIARKNFLFSCTEAGADSLGIHFSLILTAKLHGLNPMTYYETVLKKIPFCKSIEDYEKLLPWNIHHDATSSIN